MLSHCAIITFCHLCIYHLSLHDNSHIKHLLLLLSRFSHVRLCAIPWTAAHQAPPSLGFSRQEHWSRLPFPSPMHESEKWKWNHSVLSDSAIPWTAAHQAPPSMGFSRQEYWSGVPLPSPHIKLGTHNSKKNGFLNKSMYCWSLWVNRILFAELMSEVMHP